MQDYFDATGIQPSQGGGVAHPAGMFDATISNTYCKPTQDQQGLMLCIEFTSNSGTITNRYNVFNKNAQAVEIAQKELSALCHAIGIFKFSYPKDATGAPIFDQCGRELRGAALRIEVGPQIDKERKETGYMEVKKVFDKNGNEPGKTPMVQPQQNANAPMQQQTNGNWGNQPAATGWGNTNSQPQPEAQPQAQPQTQWGQAAPQGNAGLQAPWMQK